MLPPRSNCFNHPPPCRHNTLKSLSFSHLKVFCLYSNPIRYSSHLKEHHLCHWIPMFQFIQSSSLIPMQNWPSYPIWVCIVVETLHLCFFNKSNPLIVISSFVISHRAPLLVLLYFIFPRKPKHVVPQGLLNITHVRNKCICPRFNLSYNQFVF